VKHLPPENLSVGGLRSSAHQLHHSNSLRGWSKSFRGFVFGRICQLVLLNPHLLCLMSPKGAAAASSDTPTDIAIPPVHRHALCWSTSVADSFIKQGVSEDVHSGSPHVMFQARSGLSETKSATVHECNQAATWKPSIDKTWMDHGHYASGLTMLAVWRGFEVSRPCQAVTRAIIEDCTRRATAPQPTAQSRS
jgi:hypothetical protein